MEERSRLLSEIEAVGNLGSRGLTTAQVQDRKRTFGLNKLPQKEGRTALAIYLSQYKNPLIYVITAAAVTSVILRDYPDAIIIAVVILLDSILGFFQEFRAEKAVVALRRLLKPTAKALRNGQTVEVDASDIVPDDIIALNDGDRIPADGELIEASSLNVNEAILTGESEPVVKGVGDQVYMGATTLSGRGLMKVTSIGVSTELGKIADSLSEIEEENTPLQLRLESFGRSLTYVVIAISAVILGIGVLSGTEFLLMVKVAVVLAIAAIPEGLPIAVTMILVIGMRAILRRKGLVKKLVAVETLGYVTTICTDKTGTLTEGIMQVVQTDFRSDQKALHVMILCNNLADPLEVAIWNKAKTMDIDPQTLHGKYRRTHEVPFSSERKYMLTVNIIGGKEVALLKGAPEIVLDFCSVSGIERSEIVSELTKWADSGLKVLALAYKQDGDLRELKNFEWLGLVGIEDPVRSSVKEAVALCHKAGIKVKIVTGDHMGTAQRVATAVGVPVSPDQVIEAKQLENMSESDLAKCVDDIVLFCRVAPHQKSKIVSALQKRGEVVAMIGDGVNDAPALKKANIGVSVGNATDVARETASLILLDNNFKTLVDTVEEGRIVFDNIKKVVAYVLSNSFAEIFTIFGAMLLGWPAPLTVPQILWIHLICDGPSDIVLGFERGGTEIMKEKPKRAEESILDKLGVSLIIVISLVSAACSLVLFWSFWQVYNDIDSGRTVVFTVLAIQELIYIFAYRNLKNHIITSGNFFANKWLFGTVALGLAQQMLALYVPILNKILGVVPLHFNDWILVLVVGFGMLLIVETVKYVNRAFYSTSPKKPCMNEANIKASARRSLR
jgi:Ca2+-transporting ATPase